MAQSQENRLLEAGAHQQVPEFQEKGSTSLSLPSLLLYQVSNLQHLELQSADLIALTAGSQLADLLLSSRVTFEKPQAQTSAVRSIHPEARASLPEARAC